MAPVSGIESPDIINGNVPEGTPVSALSSCIISASANSDGALTILYRDIRVPRTRAPVHIQRYAGITCVHQGAMRVYIDGQEDFIAGAGSCYVMPSMTKISAVAIGEIDIIMNDVFCIPCGEPIITFIESCCLDLNVADSYAMYSTCTGLQRKLERGGTFYFDPHVHAEEFSAYTKNVTCAQQDNVPPEGGTHDDEDHSEDEYHP